ncbi:MAG: LON peptidase substrate-binding domain-containing protein, partial [Pseudomonadales bacterium]
MVSAGKTQGKQSVDLADDILPIIPVRNLVVFPGEVAHVSVGRQVSIEAARLAVEQSRKLGILLQMDPTQDLPGPGDLHPVGTMVSIVRFVTAPNGMHHLICQGEQRFEPREFVEGLPFLATRFELVDEPQQTDAEIRARVVMLKERT